MPRINRLGSPSPDHCTHQCMLILAMATHSQYYATQIAGELSDYLPVSNTHLQT